VRPYSPVEVYRRFGGMYWLHVPGRRVSQVSSKHSCPFYFQEWWSGYRNRKAPVKGLCEHGNKPLNYTKVAFFFRLRNYRCIKEDRRNSYRPTAHATVRRRIGFFKTSVKI
jgi:hypothetical protein